MEKITKFKAIDGREFKTEKECLDYESLIAEVETIMKALKPTPKDDGCNFANGYSFVQQQKGIVKLTRLNLLNVIKRYIDHKCITQSMEDDTVHPSWVGRLVGETDLRPLSDAWYRISNIDKESREWGQGYFVENPDKSPALRTVSA